MVRTTCCGDRVRVAAEGPTFYCYIQQATPVRPQGGVVCAAQGDMMKCEQEP